MSGDLSTGEIAAGLQCATRTVTKWIDSGLLPGYRLPGGQHRRVSRLACLQFLRDHQMPEAWLDEVRRPAAAGDLACV
jgi:excisionase family DNA binding protein